jgi:FtsX-like permease family
MGISIVLRHAARSLWRAPTLFATVVLTIAGGVGSNVVLQSFVRGIVSADASSIAPETRSVVTLLRIAGAALFLLTCANVTSLLIFRANARLPDTALRVAVGAGRRQLAWQLFAESLILAIAGGAVAVLLGVWTTQIIPALLWAPDAEQLDFDLRAGELLAAATIAIAVLSMCGLAPLVDVKDRRPAAILQRESSGPSDRARRLRAGLIITQTAGCCVFIITAQLLLSRLDVAVQTALGMLVANPVLATVGVKPSGTRAEFEARAEAYFSAAERAARDVTGINATTWIVRPPGSAPNTQRFSVEPPILALDDVVLDARVFTARTLRDGKLSLQSGRFFTARDTPTSCRVALLSDDAAGELFGGQPLGRVVFDAAGPIEVVGVVTRPGTPRSDRVLYYYGEQTPGAVEGETLFRVPRVRSVPSVELDTNSVEASYFARMRVPLLGGKLFPSEPAACRVAVIDRMAAERYFEGSPIGAALIDRTGRRSTITGIVESSLLRHWQRPPLPTVYFPMGQEVVARMSLTLFPDESSSSVHLRELHDALASVPNGFGSVRVLTLGEHLRRSALAPERLTSLLMMCLAAITVALAAVGLHGTIQETARQRRREIALRLTLGVRPRQLTLELSRSALQLASIGSFVGGILATVLALGFEGAIRPGGMMAYWPWLSGMAAPIVLVLVASVLPVYKVLQTDLTKLLRRL